MKENLKRKKDRVIVPKNYFILTFAIFAFLFLCYCSYAIFSVSIEKKGVLNIITGNLYTTLTSADLTDNRITVPAYTSQNITITLENINALDAKFNLYYTMSPYVSDQVTVGYLTNTAAVPPAAIGDTIMKYGSSSNQKIFTVRIENKSTGAITIEFGSRVGLTNNNLTLPTDAYAITQAIAPPTLMDSLKENTIGEAVLSINSGTGVGIFQGTNPNNYVWYSGMLWRAYKFDNDGVYLVTDDNVSFFAYHNSASTWSESFVKAWLDNYFYPRLSSNRSNLLTPTEICADIMVSSYTQCNTKVSTSAGLLSLSDYNLSKNGEVTYLNNGTPWYTSSQCSSGSSRIWAIASDGVITDSSVSTTLNIPYGIRPTIKVKKTIGTISGIGTKTDPYRLEQDDYQKPGANLSTINNGEYITYDNKLWRMTDVTALRAIYDGPKLTNNLSFGTTVAFGSSSIKTNLNGMVSSAEIASYPSWYQTVYNGGNPITTSLSTTGTMTVSPVGLCRIGELFCAVRKDNAYSFWTLTPYTEQTGTGQWTMSMTGGSVTGVTSTNSAAPRPVIAFNNQKITGGQGTLEHPYTID